MQCSQRRTAQLILTNSLAYYNASLARRSRSLILSYRHITTFVFSKFTAFAPTAAGIADGAEQAVVVELLKFPFPIPPAIPSPHQHQLAPLFHRSLGDTSSRFRFVFVEAIAHRFLGTAQIVRCRASGMAQITDGGLPVN